jgi:hypothetical protein
LNAIDVKKISVKLKGGQTMDCLQKQNMNIIRSDLSRLFMSLRRIVSRNKNKISRAFRVHSYWREKLSTSKDRRHYYHCDKGEFVWIYE